MKFKLDENLGRAAAAVLLEAGFDVLTLSDQQMQGALDRDVIECCVREERCLVTLDAEFGNPLRYPPRRYHGIVLLRVPGRVTAELTSIRSTRCATPSWRGACRRGAPFRCPVLIGACGSYSRGGYGCIRAAKRTTDDALGKDGQDPDLHTGQEEREFWARHSVEKFARHLTDLESEIWPPRTEQIARRLDLISWQS